MTRTVFFISDGTGITAETLGHSLLTQFEMLTFEYVTIPYVDNIEKAQQTLARLKQVYHETRERPLVFATLINPEISQFLGQSPALFMDFFQTFIPALENELGHKSTHEVGRSHGMRDYENYMLRINAVNYALSYDDGVNPHEYTHADIILVGVSRCGKTPTCLYLALQFGIFAANYPLTEEDLSHKNLPDSLADYRQKLFGLTIEPLRLHKIREERRPNSQYSQLKRCELEVTHALALYRREQIPYLDTTARSIEEIATQIINIAGVKRRLY